LLSRAARLREHAKAAKAHMEEMISTMTRGGDG
jgi:hypothetical protein